MNYKFYTERLSLHFDADLCCLAVSEQVRVFATLQGSLKVNPISQV